MLMRVVWWVGIAGAVKPEEAMWTQPCPIARIYKDAPSEFRYAVGWKHDYPEAELVVLDLYLSQLTMEHPFVVPHFVKRFTDIDQAVAALTIGYIDNGPILLANHKQRQSVMRARGVKFDEGLAGLTPLIRRP